MEEAGLAAGVLGEDDSLKVPGGGQFTALVGKGGTAFGQRAADTC